MAFSDWRIQNIDLVIDFLRNLQEEPDLILYAGDDIRRFVEHELTSMDLDHHVSLRRRIRRNRLEEIASLSKFGLCAITGNDDLPSSGEFIRGKNVYNVHEKPFDLKKYAVIGVEGAEYDPEDKNSRMGFTLYTEPQVKKHLQKMFKRVKGNKVIILSHCPPRNTLDLAYRFGVREIGSKALRAFLERNEEKIPLVVCGHVHLQGGRSMPVGRTTIVNVASHDNPGEPGRIVVVDIVHDKVRLQWHEIRGPHETNNVYGVFGVGPKTVQKLKEGGITTLGQLSAADVERISRCLGCAPNAASKILIRARSVSEKKVIQFARLMPVEDDAAFLDIETDLKLSLVWLIGFCFSKTGELIQLVAHDRSEERSILEGFLNRMSGFGGRIYTFSGTKFDERVMKQRLRNFGLDASRLPKFIDLGIDLQRSLALPLKSYGLKRIAGYLGYKYKHPEMDGRFVATQYLSEYQRTKDKRLMKRFLEYNEDDIRSLPWIMGKLLSSSEVF